MDIVYWIRGKEFADLARLSIASVAKVYPHAHVFIYTDDAENTPDIDGTIRCELPPGRPAMVANLDAQLLHLNTADYGTKVLFLDADVLVKKPVEMITEADMLVTWRNSVGPGDGKDDLAALMPYNFGVIAATVNARTREAWTWMRSQVLNMAPQEQNWYGNQLALSALVGSPPESGVQAKRVFISWSLRDIGTPIIVIQYPCETHNFTPQAEGEDVSDKFVLHFKGNRKQMMGAYA